MTSLKKSTLSHESLSMPSSNQPMAMPIIQTIESKLFESLIKRANDSGSFDTSLEYKSLPVKQHQHSHLAENKNNKKIIRDNENNIFSYLAELQKRQTLATDFKKRKQFNGNDNNTMIQTKSEINNITPSKVPFINKKNVPKNYQTPVRDENENFHITSTPKSAISACQKLKKSLNIYKKLPTSSTPFCLERPIIASPPTVSSLNLLAPPTDARFINYENESMVGLQDNYASDADDEPHNKTLVKCFSLTQSSCRHFATTIKLLKSENNRPVASAPNSPKFERHSTTLLSFNTKKNRSSIVSPIEESPLRRQNNVKLKSSTFFNFFRSPKLDVANDAPQESNLTQTCNKLSELLAKSEEFDDELCCSPLLIKENIEHHESDLSVWKDNNFYDSEQFEFSFICEPSTSDIETEDKDYLTEFQLDENLHSKQINESILPKSPAGGSNVITAITSPFRRSNSDPEMLSPITGHIATLNADNEVNSSFVQIINGAKQHKHQFINQANIIQLNTIRVSLPLC